PRNARDGRLHLDSADPRQPFPQEPASRHSLLAIRQCQRGACAESRGRCLRSQVRSERTGGCHSDVAGDCQRLLRPPAYITALRPPSTTSTWPVTKRASSDAKKTMAGAMSSGAPQRCKGQRCCSHVSKLETSCKARVSSVRT